MIQINEAKDSPKKKKRHRTQRNAKVIDTSSGDG
jgi:hypothetical protein